ncbi:MAG: elongation factor Ts [Clostridiales bacterium]|nr:elongation factor Ts [Clostridiales bacterium]
MAVTAEMVKELRERTGAGMMDCKKALMDTDGDMEKAIELLREKGLAKAAKKAGRIAAEGLINLKVSEDGKKAVIIEVNSETDFVAKNMEFQDFVNKLTDIVLDSGVKTMEELLNYNYSEEGTVSTVLNNKIAKIGENLNIRRFEIIEDPNAVNVGYIHGGGRIGVLVSFATDASYNEIVDLGKDVAMQVAAMSPKYISEADVDDEYIENEKKILTQQALNEGKDASIVEKMVIGRLKKELKQVCLLDQAFVKDSEITVKQYIDNKAKSLGKSIAAIRMIRFEIGEGIDKKEENFAEEVAKQMNN